MERAHRALQRGDVNCYWHGATTLALVSAGSRHIETQMVVILVKIHIGRWREVIGLGSRTLDERRRHRGGHSKVAAVIAVCQTVLERFQRHKLGELHTQHLGMASQVMDHDLARLLLLGEITTLVEPPGVGRIHVEHRWAVKLHYQSTRPRWLTVRPGVGVSSLQGDVLDVCEWVFDLITSRVVVDIVCHAGLVGRVENNQVHRVLSNAPPATDCQRSTSEMRDDDFARRIGLVSVHARAWVSG